jgi:hypothetical protein
MYNILSIIYYMSYRVIAPSPLVGISLPSSEVRDPMDFMKYVVKSHHFMEGINRANFFLNTQVPGLIFQTPDGSRFIGAAKLNGKHVDMSARKVPHYVDSFNHPYIRRLPPPYMLMGVNDGTFGPTAVVGPGGLVREIGPVRSVSPIGTDGIKPVGAIISPFGVRPRISPVMAIPTDYSVSSDSPFPGAMRLPLVSPFGGLIGIRRKETIEELEKELGKATAALEEARGKEDASLMIRLRTRVLDLRKKIEEKRKELTDARARVDEVLGERVEEGVEEGAEEGAEEGTIRAAGTAAGATVTSPPLPASAASGTPFTPRRVTSRV